jgi:hypothetical protein
MVRLILECKFVALQRSNRHIHNAGNDDPSCSDKIIPSSRDFTTSSRTDTYLVILNRKSKFILTKEK